MTTRGRITNWSNRGDFLHNSLGIATLGMPHSLGVASGSDKPPNFVIILLDDSGCSDFNFPANSTYPTPNVERLVGQIP